MNNTLSKLMNKFIIKTHHFIVFEDDVLKTICTNWDHITELMVSQLITT